jgi:hypothetical protein
MKIVNDKKNNKQQLPPLGIIINFVVLLGGLALIFGVIHAFGATISTIVGVYLGYKLLRLVLRVFGLIISLFVSVVSIMILITIITLLIF